MKKALLLLSACVILTSITYANKADLFSYDTEKLDGEMTELQTLEDFVSGSPGMTLSAMQQEGNSLVRGINFPNRDFGGLEGMMTEPAAGIPSFFWGCILGPLGIILVYVMTEDNEETKKALWGFLVAVGSYVVGTVLVYVAYFVIYLGYIFAYY